MKKPKTYYCHKSQSNQPLNSLAENLQIVQKIGQGAFGQVYKVFDHNLSQIKVIKRHKRQSSQILINKQNQVMKQMSGSQGFAKIKQFYSQSCNTQRTSITNNTVKSQETNKNNYSQMQLNSQDFLNDQVIVMECLGDSLGKIQDKMNISVYSMKRIAYQLIKRLKQLHQRFYVHRDLKPDNILLGNQSNPHKVYLVDFGLVSNYRKNPQSARKIYDGVIGTVKFCSIASHYGYEQFPRDDLQSLGYVLLYLVQGQLPWRIKQKLSDEQKFQKMCKIKQSVSIQQLVKGINCMKKYFTIIRGLRIQDKINYEDLFEIFKTDSNQNYCFEFCKQSCFYKMKRLNISQKQIINNQKNRQNKKQNLTNQKENVQKDKNIKELNKYFIESKFKNK